MFAEEYPIYKVTDNFYSLQPFIFSTIFNFGGRSGMFGTLDLVSSGLNNALDDAPNLVGLGAAPEALETSPVDYDFLFDSIFRVDGPPTDVQAWVNSYVERRYYLPPSKMSESARADISSGWTLLLTTVCKLTLPNRLRNPNPTASCRHHPHPTNHLPSPPSLPPNKQTTSE